MRYGKAITLMAILVGALLPGVISPVGAAETKAAAAGDAKTTAAAGEMVPLVLHLPTTVPVGTPKNVKLAGIEIVTQRAPFLVPKDVTLISLKTEVSGSDKEPLVGTLANVTDGERGGKEGDFVELGPGVQWVQIDLKAPHEVYAILLWHYLLETRVYRDVIVRCADDPDFTSGARTLFNNDIDNSAGLGIGKDKEYLENTLGKLIDVCKLNGGQPVKTRYLRFYSNGNTTNEMNHYVEAEVYGRAAK